MPSGKITLQIQVDQAGRQTLQATNQLIVLVRNMKGDPNLVVACAVFSPFGDQTAIIFYTSWEAFVIQGQAKAFGLITPQSTQSIQPGQQYPFGSSGFGSVQPAYASTVFGLTNMNTSGPLSAGLSQQLNIANEDVWQPIAIADFPYNETCYFEPDDDLLIFLAKGIEAGEILPAGLLQPMQSRLEISRYPVTVGASLIVPLKTDTTIHFDDANNCFRPGPLSPI